MAEGRITELRESYGFIEPVQGGAKVFFHRSTLENARFEDLQSGTGVEYEAEEGPKGLKATVVRVREYRFLNPYNFVRVLERPRPQNHVLSDCPPPSRDRYVGLTGRITCKVKAVTPLFISDSHAVEGEAGEHRTYRFFQVDDKPALPASSLRGMFRSVFETVTNSCFVAFQEDKPYPLEHRESRAPDMIPARVVELGENGARLERLDCTVNAPSSISGRPTLVRAGAVLRSYPPRVLNQRTGQTFISQQSQLPQNAYDGMRVAALVTRTPATHRSNRYRAFQAKQVVPASQHESLTEDAQFAKVFGWLHLTGPNIENKHDERLFFRWDDKEAGSPQIDQIPARYLCECRSTIVEEYNHHLAGYWERLQRDIEELGNHRWPKSTQGVPHPSVFVEKGRQLRIGDLVYAQRDAQGNAKMLRPVSMPRIRYAHSRQSLLPEYLKRCQDYRRLCLACRVFGWVWDSPPKDADRVAYASRVRVSHGTLTHSEGELPETTLAILSSPKPTTTPFYLLNSEGRPDAAVNYDTIGVRLRGRKFYRHHGEMLREQEFKRAGGIKDDQNRTVRGALKPGATFTFTLDFENLAPLELGALLYALELEDGMVHRLGYAKPLGFGSVKLMVESVQAIDWGTRLRSVEANAGWESIDGAHYKQEFLKAMQTLYRDKYGEVLGDLRALLGAPPELPIHYPRSSKEPQVDGKNYEWFVGNKRRVGGRNLPAPVVPAEAKDDVTGLPLIDKDGNKV